MSLRALEVPTAVVRVDDGEPFNVRGLTRGEALTMKGLGADDVAAIECHLLAYGTDTPLADAEQWYRGAPAAAVDALIKAIVELSGLGEKAERPTPEG